MGKKVRYVNDVAREFGVTIATIHNWKRRGMPGKDGGFFDIDKIGVWSGNGRFLGEQGKAEVVSLAENTGKTQEEIGRIVGVSRQAVNVVLNRYQEERPLREFYKKERANLMVLDQAKNGLLRRKLLDSLTDDELDKLGFRDKIDAYVKLGQDSSNLFRDERLELDKTTENVGVMVAFINKMKEEDGRAEG